jgi:hypothetical protein
VITHWDGTAWAPEVSAEARTVPGTFSSVDCTSADACWAAGSTTDESGNTKSMSSRWDGHAWNTIPTDGAGVLASVACASRVNCWAVGATPNVNGLEPLAEWWTGNGWSARQTAPLPPPVTTRANALMLGTACTPHECWAVGGRSNGVTMFPLIERVSTRSNEG